MLILCFCKKRTKKSPHEFNQNLFFKIYFYSLSIRVRIESICIIVNRYIQRFTSQSIYLVHPLNATNVRTFSNPSASYYYTFTDQLHTQSFINHVTLPDHNVINFLSIYKRTRHNETIKIWTIWLGCILLLLLLITLYGIQTINSYKSLCFMQTYTYTHTQH